MTKEQERDCYIASGDWKTVKAEELKAMGRNPENPQWLTGLALSGGGIRSASFSLGALQALVAAGRLENVDYMSTVSGGGYIGSALTWFTNYTGPKNEENGEKNKAKDGEEKGEDNKNAKKPLFGVTDSDFPLGARDWSALPLVTKKNGEELSDQIKERNTSRTARLDHLRQHGNYLKPGTLFELFSMIWMIIQSMLLPMIVYFCILFVPITAIAYASHITLASFLCSQKQNEPVSYFICQYPLLTLAIFLSLIVAAIFILVPPIIQFVKSLIPAKISGSKSHLRRGYRWRKIERTIIGPIFLVIIGVAILGIPPAIDESMPNYILPSFGGVGLAATLGQLVMQVRSVRLFGGRSGSIIITIACFGLVLGLLWLAYQAVDYIGSWPPRAGGFTYVIGRESDAGDIVNIEMLVSGVLASVIIGGILGGYQNINLIGLHRLYRDRLMETFLPDFWDETEPNESTDAFKRTRDANTASLSDMYRKGNGPYHIINANIVLTGSPEPRYRGRGGTNFILSPLYCGSDASGWRRSDHWTMHAGPMTLSSAMAVSGAAINPRTGAIDRSKLREPLLSFLMSLTNFRLGLWAVNPRAKQGCCCKKNGDLRRRHRWPNFLVPGIRQGLWPRQHHQEREFVELTDGAHFDNTGLYELIRRKLKLIIMIDGTADKDINYQSLANALERIRVDFGVQIRFEEASHDLEGLLPDPEQKSAFVKKYNLADRGYAIARIDYQPLDARISDAEDGTLVIIKSTMVKSLPADVLGYKSANKDFPNESTADQFFDEVQLEAYRELGYRITKGALEDPRVKWEFDHAQ